MKSSFAPFRIGVFPTIVLAVLTAGPAGRTRAAPTDDMFSRERAERFDLQGLTVWLGTPVRVTSQVGWQKLFPHRRGQPEGVFIHITPVMARFPNGNLIVTYPMDTDSDADPVTLSAYQISQDGGRTWGRRYSVLMQHNPMIYIPGPGDTLTGIGSELYSMTPGDDRNFVGTWWVFKHGGTEMTMKPDAMRVLDFPWPTGFNRKVGPPADWWAGPCITGSYTKVGGRLLVPAEVQENPDRPKPKTPPPWGWSSRSCEIVLASEDGGGTWRYFSTMADPDPALSDSGYEGPNEGFILPLADGSLMGVYRIGGGRHYPLHRRYSTDGGKTWLQDEALPAWSVKPELVRTADGIVALTTGRPGVYLWLSTDPRAASWQSIDLVKHHNKYFANVHDQIRSFLWRNDYLASGQDRTVVQSTAYTGLVDAGNGRLFICYDRCPEEVPTGPDDRSSVFVVPVQLERP